MPYIGAGIQEFNTANNLTVSGTSELKNNVTVTGDVTASGTVLPTGDTAAGDAAALGFTSAEGLILTGQGSTSDITVKNDADTTVFTVPTGTDDILFPDNAKAIFGAGSDLRLYHDGSNSYVEDAGSGYLVLKGSDPGIALQNSSAANLLLTGTNDISLLFSGNAKLATTNTGVDITGTAVTDGLTSECAAGDSNLALTAYHPTSTSARNIAKFQSNVGSTQADVVTIGCDGGIEAVGEITSTGGSLSQNSNSIRTAIGNDGGSGTFGTSTNHALKLFTNNTQIGLFDTDGNFLVAGTSTTPGLGNTTTGLALRADGIVSFSGASNYFNINRNGTGTIQQFNSSGNTKGSVTISSSGVTYATTSDIRLKQDIEPLDATDKLMAMNPVSYNWKADPDGPRSMGFIAQEMEEIMPEAVNTGNDGMMQMDYGRITPILVSALQDAHKKIEELESRIAMMESK